MTEAERNIEQTAASEATCSTNKEKPRSFFLSSLPFFILAHATHHLLTALPQPMLPFIQDDFG